MENLQFKDLNCSDEIIRAVKDMGFEEATPIQSLTIPLILEGKDIVGQAQTGTGKTAAFGIPIIDKVDSDNKNVQVLILTPTRELAVQISEELSKIAKYKKGIKILPIYGGQPIERQIKRLKSGVQIVVGTPGRVMDHLRRRTLKPFAIKYLVLDEADEMLNMGFREDIEKILENISDERQTLLFSATMPRPILEIIDQYQKDPQIVKVTQKELTTPNVKQMYVEVKERDKVEVLSRLIDKFNPKLAIVFCNTKKKVDEVTDILQSRGYLADKIHGDMKQNLRMNIIDKFKRGDIEILVATDVAARGLDIDNVETVFNYDLPNHDEYYVHRIGRTGRAGKTGSSISFVTPRDNYLFKNIMKLTKKKMKRLTIPTLNDIEAIRTDIFLGKVKNSIAEGNLKKYIRIVERLVDADYSPVKIAAALLKMELEMKDSKEIETFKPKNKGKKFKKHKRRKKNFR